MVAEGQLAGLRDDACRRVPDPPNLPEVIDVTEDIGRRRLAAYYLYAALLAGVIGDDDLSPGRWPPKLAVPMARLDLTRFAPRTGRGLDAQLTQAEQATRRSQGRQPEFAHLLVDEDQWELVAQHLAGAPLGGELARADSAPGFHRAAPLLKNSGIAHAVSLGVNLAVGLHPLGTVAGLGARLIQVRIQAGRDQADALHRLGQELRTLHAQAGGELTSPQAGKSA